MHKRHVARWAALLGVAAAGLLLATASGPQGTPAAGERQTPEFRDRSAAAWLNSAPLSRADLLGHVVLIEIWAAG